MSGGGVIDTQVLRAEMGIPRGKRMSYLWAKKTPIFNKHERTRTAISYTNPNSNPAQPRGYEPNRPLTALLYDEGWGQPGFLDAPL